MNKHEMYRERAIKGAKTQKERGTGFFSLASREKSLKTRREKDLFPFKNKEFAAKAGSIGVKTQIKNRTGFHDPKNQLRASLLGYNKMQQNKNLFFNGVYFGSKTEAEIGLCFHEQIEKIKNNKNFQVISSIYTLDFVSHTYKSVLEVHQVIPYFDKNETDESYYNKRREILNANGYKNYNLVVIK